MTDELWRRAGLASARRLYKKELRAAERACRVLLGRKRFADLRAEIDGLRPGRMERNGDSDEAKAVGRLQDHSHVYFAIIEGTKTRLGHESFSTARLIRRDRAIAAVWAAIERLQATMKPFAPAATINEKLAPLVAAYKDVLDPEPSRAPGRINWDFERLRLFLTRKRPGGRPRSEWRATARWMLKDHAGLAADEIESLLDTAGLTARHSTARR